LWGKYKFPLDVEKMKNNPTSHANVSLLESACGIYKIQTDLKQEFE